MYFYKFCKLNVYLHKFNLKKAGEKYKMFNIGDWIWNPFENIIEPIRGHYSGL